MAAYEDYNLQLFARHDYYGLMLIDCPAQNEIIYRRVNVISKLIYPGYNCKDEFFWKQWTDFSKIRSALTDINKRKTYDYYSKHTIKIDSNQNSITDWWYPCPKPQVCEINILALIKDRMTYVHLLRRILSRKNQTSPNHQQKQNQD